MNHFLFMKQEMARLDKLRQLNDEQQQIQDYENEARYLEQLESDLIRKLQETQQVERHAFGKLESAMLESSLPKKARVLSNASAENSLIISSNPANVGSSSRSKKNSP